MRIVKFEMKRAFQGRLFLISLILGGVICALDLLSFYIEFGTKSGRYLLQAWIGTDYLFAYRTMFYILLPLLASLPYGGSLYSDMKTGYDKNICIKASRLQYAFAKSISVFVTAFVSVVLPLALNLFMAAGIYPNYICERLSWLSPGMPENRLFTAICNQHPALYCLIFILIDGLFAGVIALTSLSIAKVVKSHFTAVVTPMVIYIIEGAILVGDESGNWGVMDMLVPAQSARTLWYQLVTSFLLILVANAVIIWGSSRKRDVI